MRSYKPMDRFAGKDRDKERKELLYVATSTPLPVSPIMGSSRSPSPAADKGREAKLPESKAGPAKVAAAAEAKPGATQEVQPAVAPKEEAGHKPVEVDAEKADPIVDALAAPTPAITASAPVPAPTTVPTPTPTAAPVSTKSAAPNDAPPTPAKRRPPPPKKGILKPPPPPMKPTLGNRLRDAFNTAAGGAKSLFDPLGDVDSPGAGPSQPVQIIPGRGLAAQQGEPARAQTVGQAVGGTLGALSGKIGLGLSRLVAAQQGKDGSISPQRVPSNDALTSLGGLVTPMSDKPRQKQSLKRATFLLPSLSITYPISSQGEPWSQQVLSDREKIETDHRALVSTLTGAEYWTSQRLLTLYESACRGREERPRIGVVRALETLSSPPRPRSIHLALRPSGEPVSPPPPPHLLESPLGRHAADSFADLLVAEWALSDLRLENGVLEHEDALKAVLHALLISGTLPTLSLKGNRRIKSGGWRLLAVFLKKARSLKYIDLSDTNWDRKGVDYLVQALNSTRVQTLPSETVSLSPSADKDLPSPPCETLANGQTPDEKMARIDSYGSFLPPAPLLKEAEEIERPAALQTLRMDGCGLRAGTLEALAQGIRSSDLKNISLRRNRIGPMGAVSLALMMRDYPDSAISHTSLTPSLNSLTAHPSTSPLSSTTLSNESSPYATYVPRSRRRNSPVPAFNSTLPDEPTVVVSSPGHTKTLVEGYRASPTKNGLGIMTYRDEPQLLKVDHVEAQGRFSPAELGGASMALQRSVRALDGVERIGRLLTLDLKGNEIRTGVSYIAQVLKRNRTLKVLNISDNRIEPLGLAQLAEALKYNSVLETLDMSNNPCCGPMTDGVLGLRHTLTMNTTLKRLFLADTFMGNDSAILLAECLPETRSLLHLDVTQNPAVDTAGILAFSSGLRSNKHIRCLDITIPATPDMAEVSQGILQSCIRNTELAVTAAAAKAAEMEREASSNGEKGPTHGPSQEAIWLPIKRSALVRHVKEADEARASHEREKVAKSPEGQARDFVYQLEPSKVLEVAESTARDLQKWYDAAWIAKSRTFHAWEPGQLPKLDYVPLLSRGKVLRERIQEFVQDTSEDMALQRLLELNDTLGQLVQQANGFVPPPRLLLPSQIVSAAETTPLHVNTASTSTPNSSPAPWQPGQPRSFHNRRHMRNSSLEISSPNFSIGDSDGDSDAEELDTSALLHSSPPAKSKFSGGTIGIPSPLAGKTGLGFSMGGEGGYGDVNEGVQSPVDRVSRAWIEEEGEIFRKGMRLGVAEDEEVEERGEVSGEELRQEILDTPVERGPARQIPDEEEEGEREGEGEEGDTSVTHVEDAV